MTHYNYDYFKRTITLPLPSWGWPLLQDWAGNLATTGGGVIYWSWAVLFQSAAKSTAAHELQKCLNKRTKLLKSYLIRKKSYLLIVFRTLSRRLWDLCAAPYGSGSRSNVSYLTLAIVLPDQAHVLTLRGRGGLDRRGQRGRGGGGMEKNKKRARARGTKAAVADDGHTSLRRASWSDRGATTAHGRRGGNSCPDPHKRSHGLPTKKPDTTAHGWHHGLPPAYLWLRSARCRRRTRRASPRAPGTWRSSTWSWSTWGGSWPTPGCGAEGGRDGG